VGSIRRTPPRAFQLAAMLAAAALAIPQLADARATSSSGGGTTPAAPTGLTASKATTNTAPALWWNAVTGAANYRVYRDGTQVAKLTSRSFSDTGRSRAFSGAIELALQNGGVVGFQAAGPRALTDCNRMAYSIDDGIRNYQMRFYEEAPSQVSQCQSLLLSGASSLQSRLAAQWGG
jgi:hypothetical protein